MRNYYFIVVGIFVLTAGWVAPVSAEIGFELYSWKKGSKWNYAVIEGTATARSKDFVQSPRHRLKDVTFLKGRIAQLPSGDRLYWRVNKEKGFILPSQEVIRQVADFATSANIKLFLPGETKDSQALKQMQTDLQDIIDAYQ